MVLTLTSLTLSPNALISLGVGFGVLFVFFGVLLSSTSADPVARRMRATAQGYTSDAARKQLLKTPDKVPEGILKALIPENRSERTMIRFRLRQAGFDGPNAVRNFFALRLGLAMFAPTLAIILFSLRAFIAMPPVVDDYLNGLSSIRVMQVVTLCVAVAFYTPTYWLNGKIKARRLEIEQGFPNALDLIQISAAAGLGFDTALTRVAQSLEHICPAIAEEFHMCQAEVLAGRPREQALNDMAERMGVDEVTSFVALISQSMEYGTSISEALNAYAVEMREGREMKAQEKANKLPVQMSGVMAMMMLPALFLITLGPTIIRYMTLFGTSN